MINKIINIIFFTTFLIFTTVVIKYYISEKNITFTNKSRNNYTYNDVVNKNLPVLKNDTNNIITYKNDLEEFNKKRKKRFWEKIISND
jgi:hypothetical protein